MLREGDVSALASGLSDAEELRESRRALYGRLIGLRVCIDVVCIAISGNGAFLGSIGARVPAYPLFDDVEFYERADRPAIDSYICCRIAYRFCVRIVCRHRSELVVCLVRFE